MKSLATCMVLFCATSAWADIAIDRLVAAAQRSLPQLPVVHIAADIAQVCGGAAHGPGVYCPSEGLIFVSQDVIGTPQAPYVLGHLYGHAAQVTYGVADIALAAIRADPAREVELRGMVTRQVECVAGVLVARAGLGPLDLNNLFDAEPMTGSHWGRNPVRTGPRVSIGLQARAEWFAIGQVAPTFDACSLGEMSADLIARNDDWP